MKGLQNLKKKSQKNKLNFKENYLLLPIIILFGVLVILVFLNLFFKNKLLNKTLINTNFSTKSVVFPTTSSQNYPELSAGGAIVMDAQSKQVIFSKNINVRFSPASTTKIMTALTALSYYKNDDILTVNDGGVDSDANLFVGERLKFINLLYAMMLPSDNRAASTIADNYPGGKETFVAQMNENAKNWNLNSTHFADPVGLLDDNDFTTPKDLAILASIAIKNSELTQIASTKNIIITTTDGRQIELNNLNILLGDEGVTGLKTGHTDLAGDVLVTTQLISENGENHQLIIVVMKSDNRFVDTLNILNYLKNNITYLTIHP